MIPPKTAPTSDAAAAPTGKAKAKPAPPPSVTQCQNCGATITGKYCHHCGQVAEEPRRAAVGLVQDVFVDTLSIDSKLARSLALLLYKPGVLARRYLDGKRASYSPPFRLYLFASVFFFFVLFATSGNQEGLLGFDPTADEQALETLSEEKPAEVSVTLDGIEPGTEFSDMKWGEIDYNGPAWFEPHAEKLFNAAQNVRKDPRLFVAQIRENVPRTLLLAPVVYGLLLALLYVYRRTHLLYDHFVASLYMHAALYAYLVLAMVLSAVPIIGGLWFIPLLWGWAQPILVFRHVYGSGWMSAWGKWAISMSLYFIAFLAITTLGISFALYQS